MKKWTKLSALLLAVTMAFTVVPAEQVAAAKVNVQSVSVSSSLSGNNKTVVVASGKTVKLKTIVKVTPSKKANQKVSYKSKNSAIASVDAKGNVKGIKAGTTKITVTSKKNSKKKASINVKVTKSAVTKVALNKKTAAVNVGGTLALTAKVSAKKGADKTVHFTSSNEKVAVVDAKGNVKAVSAGKATIKAAAIDGSGKSASCKVTVNNAINMTGIQILNAQSVTFSLSAAYPLAADKISVMTKTYSNGEYRRQCVIDNISTADNKNYTVVLNNDSRMDTSEYVKVSIPSLTGTVKSIETFYTEPKSVYTYDSVSSWSVGEYDSTSFYGGSAGYGGVSLSIDKLPAGLTAENKNSVLVIKGTPTTAGVTKSVITAIDELGNTSKRTVSFIVGSNTVIAAAATPYYGIISSEKLTTYKYPSVTGGSGNYEYKVINDPNGIMTNCDSDGEVYTQIGVAGSYAVTVRVSDAEDANKYCDVTIPYNIVQGIAVGGGITDAQGNKITSDVEVSFKNKDKANRYCTYASAYPNSDGIYSAVVVAGNYDITVRYDRGDSPSAQATKYLYNQSLTASQTGYDLSLPLYKVVLTGEKQEDGSVLNIDRSWYVDNEYVGYGSTFYLKAGTYQIQSSKWENETGTTNSGDWFNGGKTITTYQKQYVAANVTLVNSGVQTAAHLVTEPAARTEERNWAGIKNTTVTADTNSWEYIESPNYGYKFVPSESGNYKLNMDYYPLYIFDADGKKAATDSADDAYTKIYALEAGKTYYIAAGEINYSYNEFKIRYLDDDDYDDDYDDDDYDDED